MVKHPNPSQPDPSKDEYAQWQAEETARLNALAAQARKMGIIIPTGAGASPLLNPDGSMASDEIPR